MHQAQAYLSGILPAAKAMLSTFALSAAQAASLRTRLHNDSVGYAYSCFISIAHAARGIDANAFTWATVQLYYSAFYAARFILGAKDICFFYVGGSPYSIDSVAGAIPRKLSGTTHGVVLDQFAQRQPYPVLLSQQIGGIKPLDWLRTRREEANYGKPKFVEPGTPTHFTSVVTQGVRRSLQAYLDDNGYLYAFDEDHAMVAYPIELLKRTITDLNAMGSVGVDLVQADRDYVASLYKDARGPMPFIRTMLFKSP